MNEENEKRMIGDTGYEVRHTFPVAGKEILLAENKDASDGMIYMTCSYKDIGIIAEYSCGIGFDDYLEAVTDFTERINKEAENIRAERDALGLPRNIFTVQDCYPHSYSESIAGKVVAIKAEALAPEFRRGDVQLVYAVSGNGTIVNPRGNAVYCYHLNDGTHTRFERHQVLGEVKELPDWAKEGLERIQSDMAKPISEKVFAGNYRIIERMEAGEKSFALGYCKQAVNPYGTWQGYKDSKSSFDHGHYFNDYETAKHDLHERTSQEQLRTDRTKRESRVR